MLIIVIWGISVGLWLKKRRGGFLMGVGVEKNAGYENKGRVYRGDGHYGPFEAEVS